MNRRLASGSWRKVETRRAWCEIRRSAARLKIEAVLERGVEDRKQLARLLGEFLLVLDADAPAFHHEAVDGAPAQRRRQAEQRSSLLAAFLQQRAENAREIAHVARDQEVMLHETFDRGGAGAVHIAQARRDVALQIEGQAVFGPAGEIVDVAAHRGQEIVSLDEARGGLVVDDALVGELAHVGDAVEIFGDPVQCVEIAQAPLVLFDIGFQAIAGIPELQVAFVAFVELGLDEFRRRAALDLFLEAGDQFGRQFLVAPHPARFEERGADSEVGSGLADILVHRAHRVADFQAKVPQHIEHKLHQLLGEGRRLVGQQE